MGILNSTRQYNIIKYKAIQDTSRQHETIQGNTIYDKTKYDNIRQHRTRRNDIIHDIIGKQQHKTIYDNTR